MTRRTIVRISALVVIILLAFAMFRIGKQHSILLDDKTVTVQGQEYKALDIVEVQVGKQDSVELVKRDRDVAVVTGQSHKIKVTYTDAQWNEIELERKIKIPFDQEMIIFSVPAFIENPDDDTYYLMPFETNTVEN
ncbi:MAG: DUF6672 family protein [Sphaerochaeta sp.]